MLWLSSNYEQFSLYKIFVLIKKIFSHSLLSKYPCNILFLFWKLYVYIKLIIAETYQSHNRVVRFRQILSILVFHVSKLYHHFIRYTISNFLHCVSRYGVLIEVPLSDINNIFTYASLIRKIVPPFSFLSPFLLLYNLMHYHFEKNWLIQF